MSRDLTRIILSCAVLLFFGVLFASGTTNSYYADYDFHSPTTDALNRIYPSEVINTDHGITHIYAVAGDQTTYLMTVPVPVGGANDMKVAIARIDASTARVSPYTTPSIGAATAYVQVFGDTRVQRIGTDYTFAAQANGITAASWYNDTIAGEAVQAMSVSNATSSADPFKIKLQGVYNFDSSGLGRAAVNLVGGAGVDDVTLVVSLTLDR